MGHLRVLANTRRIHAVSLHRGGGVGDVGRTTNMVKSQVLDGLDGLDVLDVLDGLDGRKRTKSQSKKKLPHPQQQHQQLLHHEQRTNHQKRGEPQPQQLHDHHLSHRSPTRDGGVASAVVEPTIYGPSHQLSTEKTAKKTHTR